MISPELLPASTTGEIEQSTEATLGQFEIHDFILYHMVRCGYSPAKILFLSQFATFTQPYPREVLRADDANLLQPVLSPAIQTVVHSRRSQGRHREPLAPRRLADAVGRRFWRVAQMEFTVTHRRT